METALTHFKQIWIFKQSGAFANSLLKAHELNIPYIVNKQIECNRDQCSLRSHPSRAICNAFANENRRSPN